MKKINLFFTALALLCASVGMQAAEEVSTCPAGTLVDGKVIHELGCCTIVQEKGEATKNLKSASPWVLPNKSIMTITPKAGVSIEKFIITCNNTTLGVYFRKSAVTNATAVGSNNPVEYHVTNPTEPVVFILAGADENKIKQIDFTYTQEGGSTEPDPEPATTFTVTVTAENGTVAGLADGGLYEVGTEATLTATPAEGYEFVNWTVGGNEVSTANPYTFKVEADLALVANFKATAVEPEPEPQPTTETVYFINTKKWAKVNVYAWTTDPNASWPGAAATKEAEQIAGYDVYSYTANAGAYKNVIFNDGSSQTPDLVWTAGKYYVMDMNWMTKEEAETKLAAPLPEVWTVVGAKGLMGADWNLNEASNNMTLQADGTYQLVKTDIVLAAGNYDYKAAKDHAWTTSVPQSGNQTLKITTGGTYDVTFVLNVSTKTLTATATLKQEVVVIPTIQVAGDMTSWGDAPVTLVMAADSLTATATIKLDAKTYEFKMVIGGNWQSDAKTVNRDNNSTVFTGANSDTNTKLVADVAGNYIFTWTYETKTLTVTYPEAGTTPDPETPVEPEEPEPTPAPYYVVGTFNNWTNPDENYAMAAEGDIYTKTLTLGADSHKLKVTNGTWVDGGNWGYNALSEVPAGVTNDADGNIVFTLAEAGDVVVTFNGTNVTIVGNFQVSTEPAVVTYVLMGVQGDWNTGIALTVNPDNENEYVLLGQEIAVGDSVKVVTLSDGKATAWCGNVDEASPVEYINEEGNGNIVLVPGKYDFYFKLNDLANPEDDCIYIGFSQSGPSTALDNIQAAEVPVKFFRNGQLIILKNGVEYNAQGAQL